MFCLHKVNTTALLKSNLALKYALDITVITEVYTKTVSGETTLIGITYFSEFLIVFILFVICCSIFKIDQLLNHSDATQNCRMLLSVKFHCLRSEMEACM